MSIQHESRPFFYGVLVLSLLLVVYVLWPYGGEVAVGLLAAVLFRPLYDKALGWRWTGGRELVATAVTLLAIALTVLVPLLVAVTLITSQSQRLLAEVQSRAGVSFLGIGASTFRYAALMMTRADRSP